MPQQDAIQSASPKKGWRMSSDTKYRINWSLLFAVAAFALTHLVYMTRAAAHIEEKVDQGVKSLERVQVDISGIRSDFKEVQKQIQDLQVRTTLLEHNIGIDWKDKTRGNP